MKFSTCLIPSWIKEWYDQKKQGFLTQTRISPHSPGRIISSPQTHLTSYHKNHKVIKSNHQHLCHKQGLRTTIPPPMIITPHQLPHKTSNSASLFCQSLSWCPVTIACMICLSCCLWTSWAPLQTPHAHPHPPETAPGSLSHTLQVKVPENPLLLPWFPQDHPKQLSRSHFYTPKSSPA